MRLLCLLGGGFGCKQYMHSHLGMEESGGRVSMWRPRMVSLKSIMAWRESIWLRVQNVEAALTKSDECSGT